MLTIRLTRVGKKKQPSYRVIVSEKIHDPWGKALEFLGTYRPLKQPAEFEVKTERINYWLSKGAQCSDTMWNLLLENKVVKGEKRKLTTLSGKRKERLAKKAEIKTA